MDGAAARALDAQVAGCAASHQRLLAAISQLTDDDCRTQSPLSGWTRGHVLNHHHL
ncbi:MAG: maleylpyruvate isomerase N-terminal domain-containing protein, partial [Ilumatobacteraceae bacterium]